MYPGGGGEVQERAAATSNRYESLHCGDGCRMKKPAAMYAGRQRDTMFLWPRSRVIHRIPLTGLFGLWLQLTSRAEGVLPGSRSPQSLPPPFDAALAARAPPG